MVFVGPANDGNDSALRSAFWRSCLSFDQHQPHGTGSLSVRGSCGLHAAGRTVPSTDDPQASSRAVVPDLVKDRTAARRNSSGPFVRVVRSVPGAVATGALLAISSISKLGTRSPTAPGTDFIHATTLCQQHRF